MCEEYLIAREQYVKRIVSATSHRECRERNSKIEKQRGATKTVQKLCKGNNKGNKRKISVGSNKAIKQTVTFPCYKRIRPRIYNKTRH